MDRYIDNVIRIYISQIDFPEIISIFLHSSSIFFFFRKMSSIFACPVEVLMLILALLSTRELIPVSLTCKSLTVPAKKMGKELEIFSSEMDFEPCLKSWFAFFEKDSKISDQTLDMTSDEGDNVCCVAKVRILSSSDWNSDNGPRKVTVFSCSRRVAKRCTC